MNGLRNMLIKTSYWSQFRIRISVFRYESLTTLRLNAYGKIRSVFQSITKRMEYYLPFVSSFLKLAADSTCLIIRCIDVDNPQYLNLLFPKSVLKPYIFLPEHTLGQTLKFLSEQFCRVSSYCHNKTCNTYFNLLNKCKKIFVNILFFNELAK